MSFDREQFAHDLAGLAERDPPVRWRHQGRDPDSGLDCIGFLRWGVIQQQPLPDELETEFTRPYHTHFDGWNLLAVMRRWLQEIEPGHEQPGDILLFFWKRNPQHVAVLLPNNEVVEAVTLRHGRISKVIKQPLDARRRIVTIFRVPTEWTMHA